jgi:hypothetical protein
VAAVFAAPASARNRHDIGLRLLDNDNDTGTGIPIVGG